MTICSFFPVATEAQVFLLKTPQSFFTLFQPPGGPWGADPSEAMSHIDEELHFATQTLLNVCVTLNEFPHIRFYNPTHPPLGAIQASSMAASTNSARMNRLRGPDMSANDHFTKRLATRLQLAIDAYVRDNEPKQDPGRPRGILFITDRSMDTLAPFLHEFSYQAMCHDLLPIVDGNKYQYRFYNSDGQREDKEAILSDEDNVWTGIRHLHIVEAIDKLSRDFKQHAGEAGQFANNASSLNDMRDMLASLPHMQEMKEKLSLHLTMAQACMNRFEQSRLPAQAMVEQNCATRTTPEGQKPRTLVEEMVPLLDAQDVSNADKVRIIALYIMYSDGVPDEDRRRLFQHARLGISEMDAVNNLIHLGARVVKDSTSSGWDAWFKKGKRKQVSGENEYELSRYQPLVKLMVEDHFAGRLDSSLYPYFRDAPAEALQATGMGAMVGNASGLVTSAIGGAHSSPTPARPQPSSLRSAKPTWHQKGRPGGGSGGGSSGSVTGVHSTRQRVIVFVAGGITYSEVRSVYELSNKLNRDVYIGSSHAFTPISFIDALKHFGKATNSLSARGQAGATAMPNGASRLSAPENDVSGIRAHAAKAKHAFSQGHHEPFHQAAIVPVDHSMRGGTSYDQELQTKQNIYDRRFAAPSLESRQPQSQDSLQPSPQKVNGRNGAPSYASHQVGETSARTSSPAPSSVSDTSRLKEKKRMKNPFSFKKG